VPVLARVDNVGFAPAEADFGNNQEGPVSERRIIVGAFLAFLAIGVGIIVYAARPTAPPSVHVNAEPAPTTRPRATASTTTTTTTTPVAAAPVAAETTAQKAPSFSAQVARTLDRALGTAIPQVAATADVVVVKPPPTTTTPPLTTTTTKPPPVPTT
jgi:hypothetical protein